jgi:hypothetical protein
MTRTPARAPRTKPKLMRSRIAAQAARLMADDGIDDFSLAKRKAARQLGVPATQSLPNNEEIEAELRIYRELYQADEHPAVILELRRKALAAMRFFDRFLPYLTGAVLRGTAGRHSVINVQLFAANEKEIEFFLLDHQIPYNVSGQSEVRHVNRREVNVIRLEWDGTPLRLELCEPAQRHAAIAPRFAEIAPERAGIDKLTQLIAGEQPRGACS